MHILFISHMPTTSKELLLFARYLRRAGNGSNLSFYCAGTLWSFRDVIKTALELGVDVYGQSGERITEAPRPAPLPEAIASHPSTPSGCFKAIKRILPDTVIRYCRWGKLFLNFAKEMRERRRNFRQLLERLKPDVILCGGEHPERDSPMLTHETHKKGIKTLLLSGIFSNGEEVERVLASSELHTPGFPFNTLAAKLFPRWVRHRADGPLLRIPSWQIFYWELLRIAPQRPWVFNGGASENIIGEARALVDVYTAQGNPAEKYALTGVPSDDDLAELARQGAKGKSDLLDRYGFRKEKPLLVCGLPSDAHYLYPEEDLEFRDHAEIVSFTIEQMLLLRNAYNVLIAPHPGIDKASLAAFECGALKIASHSTHEIIPFCDIYIAACASSTIRWAIACGIPVLNFDSYNLRQTNYTDAKGVVSVYSKECFRQELHKIVNDRAHYGMLCDRQKRDAPRWGILDGKASERILAVLKEMTGVP